MKVLSYITAVLCLGCHFIYNNGGQARFHSLGETRRPAGNCFATPVLVGRDATAAIVVNEMRETAVYMCHVIFESRG